MIGPLAETPGDGVRLLDNAELDMPRATGQHCGVKPVQRLAERCPPGRIKAQRSRSEVSGGRCRKVAQVTGGPACAMTLDPRNQVVSCRHGALHPLAGDDRALRVRRRAFQVHVLCRYLDVPV